jgi:serine/threonine-protein kinase
MSPSHPKSVGSCAIEELLGKGGMAEVFLGRQEGLDRLVAVKAILPELKAEAEPMERFKREALALAALQHENIVAVHELVEKFGRPYLIMEYVDGVDLAEVLKGGPLPIDVALIVGVSLSRALEHAHFRRVVHRDIKPGNVMLSRAGQVKLTDFGIAKDLTMDDLTRQGLVVGTLSYLAPEQILGGRAEPRSDLYSLGVLLFQLLSGHKPHRAADQGDLLRAIVQGRRVKLREVAPRLPRALVVIVERCLDLAPDKRYQRAADLGRDLERLLAAVLEGTSAGRLVAFLKERNLLAGRELTMLAAEEVDLAKPADRPETVLANSQFEPGWTPGRRRRGLTRGLLWVALTLLVLALGAAGSVLIAPARSQAALRAAAAWIEARAPGLGPG